MLCIKCILYLVMLMLSSISYAGNYALEVGRTKNFYGTKNSAIFYEASDPTVIKLTPISVDNNGQWTLQVAGLKQGMSMFYFSYYRNGVKINETHTIEVIDINSIRIPESLTLTIGDTHQISPVIQDSRMKYYLMEWHSTDESIATVDNDYTQRVDPPDAVSGNYVTEYVRGGNVVAKKVGTAKIYCTYKGISSGICELTITPIYVSDIDFEDHCIKVDEFETINVTPSILPDNATIKSIKWASSDPNIAFVDSNGNITGLRPGKTLITATAIDGSEVSSSFILEITKSDNIDKIRHEVNLSLDNYVKFSYDVEDGNPYSIDIKSSSDDWSVSSIKCNGIDDITHLNGNTYTIDEVKEPINIDVEFGYNHNVEFFDITTGVTSILANSGMKICNENGRLIISNLAIGSKIKIYTVSGILIGDFETSNTECAIKLDSGTYIISVTSFSYPNERFKVKL